MKGFGFAWEDWGLHTWKALGLLGGGLHACMCGVFPGCTEGFRFAWRVGVCMHEGPGVCLEVLGSACMEGFGFAWKDWGLHAWKGFGLLGGFGVCMHGRLWLCLEGFACMKDLGFA